MTRRASTTTPDAPRDLAAWVRAARRIVPVPAVLARVLAALDDEQRDVGDIAAIIATDPGLVAVVLRVANSAALAPPRPIDRVLDALILLGRDGVRRAVIGGVLSDALAQRQIDFLPLDAYWRMSLYTAVLAQLIAEHRQTADRDGEPPDRPSPRPRGLRPPTSRSASEAAFVAGLLHDLGRLIFYSVDAPAAHALALDHIAMTTDAQRAGADRERAEARLGVAPAAIGGAVAQAWRLPAPIVAAIGHHPWPSADDAPRHWLVDVVHVAYVLAHLCDVDSRNFAEAPAADVTAFARLGLASLLDTDDEALIGLDRWLSRAEAAYRGAETLRGGRFADDVAA